MEIFFSPAFHRVVKKLDPHLKEGVKDAVAKVIDFYLAGQKTGGLGIKHLRGTLWEARAGIQVRVLYDLFEDRLTFLLAGSHDDVKNFLKR
ncbi:MAG: hypothetical protein HYZ73_07150 [Elusimicrobia bacterium]|nr:hypothetical protein [Elusimicrobiota bacterium]